jgi:penicillin-binding protein 2
MDRSRVLVLLALTLIPLGGLEARLVQLQLVSPLDTPVDLGNRRQSVEILRAPRGRILDVRGNVLAADERSFDCYLVLEEYEKRPGPLASVLGLDVEELQQRIEEIYEKIEKQVRQRPAAEHSRLYKRERRAPYLLRKDVDFKAAIALETSPQRFPGVVVRESLKRVYPYGQAGCHLLGHLKRVTASETEFRNLLQKGYFYEGFEDLIGQDGIAQLYRRGAFHEELIGAAGAEKRYDDLLRGGSGLAILERVAGSNHKRSIDLKPSEPGTDLELTLDIEVQRDVERILSAGPHHAAAAVLDVDTGAVVALASNRLFDPNDFTPPGRPAAVKAALEDRDAKPLISRAFQDQFQLGSAFKAVTAVAGLEARAIRAEELLPCRGKFDERLAKFNCWIWTEFRGMHHDVDVHQALERSCNCYFFEAGRRVGIESVIRWGRAFGFGSATGLDLPGEAAGRIPERGRAELDVLSLSIGQHDLMVTPLQAATMMAVFANGGRRVTPHVRRGAGPPPLPLGISPATLKEVRQGLHDVVYGVHGTAKSSGLRDWKAVGKTSSAQAAAGRESHAWFAGYAPYDAPRWAIAVIVLNSGHGGEMAAPPTAKILERLVKGKAP